MSRFPSLIRDCARACRGPWQKSIRDELNQLAAEVARQDRELAALHLKNNFGFALLFAEALNAESGVALHPLAAELVAGAAPTRALAIARASDGLTPASCRPTDLSEYFDEIAGRIGGEHA